MRKRIWISGIFAACAGCVAPNPLAQGPSLWQLESECSGSVPVPGLEDCTRQALNIHYGTAWHAAPQPDALLAYLGVMGESVRAGRMSEAEARLAIADFAGQQVAAMQSIRAAQQVQNAARSEAMTQAGLEILKNASSAPVPPPPLICRTTNNPYTGATTVCN